MINFAPAPQSLNSPNVIRLTRSAPDLPSNSNNANDFEIEAPINPCLNLKLEIGLLVQRINTIEPANGREFLNWIFKPALPHNDERGGS